MSIFLQQTLTLDLCGDGTSSVFSYDTSKAPVSSGGNGIPVFSIGVPSLILGTLQYTSSPQIGLDVNQNPIYDQPSAIVALLGTTVTITFGAALKALGSTFTDGQNNQWPIGAYSVLLTFKYNSLL